MVMACAGTGLGVTCLAAISALYFPAAAAQEPKGSGKKVDEKPASIVGTWTNSVRHAVHNHLYQPVQGARDRDESTVYFEQTGDRLTGYSLSPGHEQEDWNKEGRTDFRDVKLVKGQLSFEFDIEMNHGWRHEKKSKAWIRVEAEWKGDRLIGKWQTFEKASGHELFRGEWEAWRLMPGPVLLIGGRHQDLTAQTRRLLVAVAGGGQARIVVIPTGVADEVLADTQQFRDPWLELKPWSVQVLHTRDPKTANDHAFVKPLTEATAVFFTNGHRHRILDVYRGTLVEAELKKLRARGKLIAGTGSGAAVLAERVIHREGHEQLTESGLGILPGLLTEDRNDLAQFAVAIKANPASVALLIEPGAVALVHGHMLRASGTAKVTVSLPHAKELHTLKPSQEIALPE